MKQTSDIRRKTLDKKGGKMQRNFKKIKAWQLADNLAVLVYAKSKYFPKKELYCLTSQLRRAAISVPANIVEGACRESRKEYLNFLYIARGSLGEVKYLIHLAQRLTISRRMILPNFGN